MGTLLQIALDFTSIERAIEIAIKVGGYVDIIEAGTPLIKSEGIKVIRILRALFPDKKILADLKIMDAGTLESSIAFDAGADIISVCARASYETVEETIRVARDRNKEVMVDLIGARDILSEARGLVSLAPDYFCIHTGLDEQMKGKSIMEGLRIFKDNLDLPFAVAGGIKPRDLPSIMPFNPSIVIVGGYITKAEDPLSALHEIRERMNQS